MAETLAAHIGTLLDLMQQPRETEISAYTPKDTPIYTCIRMTPEAMLDRLG